MDAFDELQAESGPVDARVSEDYFGSDWDGASSSVNVVVHDMNAGKCEKRRDYFRHNLSGLMAQETV